MTGRDGGTRERVLPAVLRMPLGVVGGLAALVVVALGVLYAGRGTPGRADRWVFSPTADSVRPPWRYAALAVDFVGEPGGAVLSIAAAVVGCLLARWPRAAVFVVVACGLVVGTTTLLKHLVGRTIHGDGNLSYPSGHTAFATTLAVVAGVLAAGWLGLGRTRGTVLVVAVSVGGGAVMGWAEVALGAHYVTDAVAGWCTGLALTPVAAGMADLVIRPRRPCPSRP
ncbi:phosphatase PAP2 family protein [Streptomyces sp. B3I8]|uniref:phosphatase PAP2 family protein n=1 Tax=Streptomyces sp. B3I8 TaxID=3042303 RepID=UPI0027894E02|nr:phosphatase PAP2 family protein [Streptomyces sp. B3I8]MDQ0789745.1 membrane-associated phospholipid phosphatase [Streptomyces sp. B3I8]